MANNVSQPAFQAPAASTVAINVTSSSAATAMQSGRLSRHYRVYNSGSEPVFIEFGGSGVTAAIPTAGGAHGGVPVAPGGPPQVFATGYDYIAAICLTGPVTLYVTPGEGMQ